MSERERERAREREEGIERGRAQRVGGGVGRGAWNPWRWCWWTALS